MKAMYQSESHNQAEKYLNLLCPKHCNRTRKNRYYTITWYAKDCGACEMNWH